jgi:lipid II:glycine glycyltransferase (peptidoglycan interpeptide bridge formation enzyme)
VSQFKPVYSELGVGHRLFCGFEVDLTQTEGLLLANMSSACRRCIRKAKKSGVTIHEADYTLFADDYYEQLQDMFKRQLLIAA